MSDNRLQTSHIVALLMGLLAGVLICVYGPADASFIPQTKALRDRLHVQTLARAEAERQVAAFVVRDSARSQRVRELEAITSQSRQAASRLTLTNRRLTDSLSRIVPPEAIALVAALDSGLVAADSACGVAVASCEQAQDSLRASVYERDMLLLASRSRADSSYALASDATRLTGDLARALERQRVISKVSMGINLVLAFLIVVR